MSFEKNTVLGPHPLARRISNGKSRYANGESRRCVKPALTPPIFPLGFLARGGGETYSSGSMGERIDKSQRRADGFKGYGGIILEEIVHEDGQ